MPRLADLQAAFAAAALDPGRPPPPEIVGPDGRPAPRRFAVYRNNVVVGLTKALEAGFPAILRLVGPDFFRAVARTYVLENPPSSPLLILYGADFPDFLAIRPELADYPYMADVARIEYAWRLAYHAADADPIDPAALAAVPPERLADLVFRLHPSLQVVRSPFPALSIFSANRADGRDREIDLSAGGEDALLVRPGPHVEARALPPGGAAFVLALGKGDPLGRAAEAGFSDDARFDLAANLRGLLESGAIVRIGSAGEAAESS